MCDSRKYPYSPYRRDWNFLGEGCSMRPKHLTNVGSLTGISTGVGRPVRKTPSCGECIPWIFCGTTQYLGNE